MRFGVYALGSFFAFFCLVMINAGSFSEQQMDMIFESVDGNSFSNPDLNYFADANLNKFAKHTGSGIIKEFHGTYYLAAWANTWLPAWLIENKELLTIVAILVLASPIIAVILHFVLLILLAVCLWAWDRFKAWQKKNWREASNV